LAIVSQNARSGYKHSILTCIKSIILMVRPALYVVSCSPLCLDSLTSQEALKAKLGTISQEAQSKLEEETAKKEAKADAKADAARKKKLVCSCGLGRPRLATDLTS
jgi:hypothetical protein